MAQNAVVGDLDEPTNVPVTTVPEEILNEEKKLATYSQTAEFKRLREFMEARISFFQNYMPNGTPIKDVSDADLAVNWKAANIVITEFQNVLNEYDRAREAVSDARR